jgi:hypothetical protein
MRVTVPKICPRCGAFYQDLTSHTCPQCFAKLDLISDADAEELIAAQERRAAEPEYVALKIAEDETFKEQSFGACFGVAAVALAVIAASVALCVIAVGRERLVSNTAPGPASQSATASPVYSGPLPPDFDEIVAPTIGSAHRRSADVSLALPGTITRIYHGVYDNGVQVFAIDNPRATDDQIAMLQFAGAVAAQQHMPALQEQELTTTKAQYVVVGPNERDMVTAIDSAPR